MTRTIPSSTPDQSNETSAIDSPGRRRFVKEVASVALVGAAVGPRVSYAGTADAHELSLLEAAHAIHAGGLTSEQYTQKLLERTHSLSSLNSFITVGDETVLEAARNADVARLAGKAKGLPGLPVGVKDSYMTRDLPTSFGTAVASGFRPATDAAVVAAMRQAGCLVLGKNNLVEMSYGLTGLNVHYGQAKNPYNPLHITGGSSCGGAASVAARLVPAALGGDTVGSIRVPSALCGVVGFKPTPGRWSDDGVAPISNTLDTTGAIARRVADCELMDSIATGNHARIDRVTPGLQGVKLAIAPRYYLDGADPEVEKVFNETVRKLKDAGASVVEVDLGVDFGSLVAHANWPLFFHETHPAVTSFLRDNKVPVTFEQIYDDLEPHIKDSWTRSVLASGSGYTPDTAYQDVLQNRRPEVQRRYANLVFAQADALIFPTTLCSAPAIAEQWQYPVAGKILSDVFLSRNTYPASCAGLPGISIPMGLLENGLPVGLEMDASSASDRALLHLARRVEEVVGFVQAPSNLT
jgi:Asp-tRNA(Asn)/Glu-tRNA(Gln) amidotransferase A subunit family amidase